jgi:hypothetical protein
MRLAATSVGSVGEYFFHVVEQVDGSWSCNRGREHFGAHAQLDDAVEHTKVIAGEHRPSEVFVHRLDGQVQSIAHFRLSRKSQKILSARDRPLGERSVRAFCAPTSSGE